MGRVVTQSVSERMRRIDNDREVAISEPITIGGSDIIIPTDEQTIYSQTIQTHNAVSVTANNGSTGNWIDCGGFDELGVTCLSNANGTVSIHWSNDGVNTHGSESNLQFTTLTKIKARYARIRVNNSDVSSQIMSAWAYLKP